MRSILLLFMMLPAVCGEALPSGRVGQPLVLTDIYIPGGEVQPLPRRDRNPPLVVRLLDTKSAQDGHRYDFEVTGLDPGSHDLANYLTAIDSSSLAQFPPLLLEITSGLPAGLALPHKLPMGELPAMGGYRMKMMMLAGAWGVGLLGILIWKRRKVGTNESEGPVQPTLGERLRPLVMDAASGKLDASGRAVLERLVIGHWLERLPEIASMPPAEAMVNLRSHAEAAPLLLALERWLHSRDPLTSPDSVEALLLPYR
jgi:hypothetical protein